MSHLAGSVPMSREDTEARHASFVARRDVQLALAAGFDIDDILWMLDLSEPASSAKVDGEALSSTRSD